jgi:hypothetical protein
MLWRATIAIIRFATRICILHRLEPLLVFLPFLEECEPGFGLSARAFFGPPPLAPWPCLGRHARVRALNFAHVVSPISRYLRVEPIDSSV